MKVQHIGTQAHFCGDCSFYRHTHVGTLCISTVGAFREKDARTGKRTGKITALGYGYFYETIIQKFRWDTSCTQCDKPHHRQIFPILARTGVYKTQREAIAGHRETVEKMVQRYARKAERRAKHGIR